MTNTDKISKVCHLEVISEGLGFALRLLQPGANLCSLLMRRDLVVPPARWPPRQIAQRRMRMSIPPSSPGSALAMQGWGGEGWLCKRRQDRDAEVGRIHPTLRWLPDPWDSFLKGGNQGSPSSNPRTHPAQLMKTHLTRDNRDGKRGWRSATTPPGAKPPCPWVRLVLSITRGAEHCSLPNPISCWAGTSPGTAPSPTIGNHRGRAQG